MSWIIVNKETNNVVCELFEQSSIDNLNNTKYKAIEASEYLCNLNKQLNGGMTYKDKIDNGLIK